MAIFTSNQVAKVLSVLYLLFVSVGTLIVCFMQVQYSPQSKYMIAFDAGSRTKGILYEVGLEKSNYGIMPINSLTECEINHAIHESVIPLESKEDEFTVHWPLNVDEENRNENADDNEVEEDKNIDLHIDLPLKQFDEIDTRLIVPNERNNKSTIDQLANQLGDCFETMLTNLTEIYLQDPKKLSQGVTMFLGATAGMRMMQLADKLDGSFRSQLIFMHIRNEFQHRLSLMSKHWPTIYDHFHTRIGVITGKEEAIAAWISASYLLRKFYSDSTHIIPPGIYDALNLFDQGKTLDSSIETARVQETAIELVRRTGVLYLGGTSIRISFPILGSEDYVNKTIEQHKENVDELKIMNVKYQVYGQSSMCFGLDRIWDRVLFNIISKNPDQQVHLHPCLNNDVQFNKTIQSLTSQFCLRTLNNSKSLTNEQFVHPVYQFNGKFESQKCYDLINELIDHEDCTNRFMFCSNSTMLAPTRNLTFIATSRLYELTRVFGEKISNIPHELYLKKMEEFCSKELMVGINRNIMIFKHAIQYCVGLHFVESMFVNVFQIQREDFVHINFINKLDKEAIEWSLGYLIGNLDLKAKPNVSAFFKKLRNYFLLLLTFSPLFMFFSFREEIKQAFNLIKCKYFTN